MGKKGKGAGDPADGPDVDAGAKAIAEVMSLRTQLGMRQTALTDAETAKRQAEEKLAKLRADFDQEQETAYEISKDMTRQCDLGVLKCFRGFPSLLGFVSISRRRGWSLFRI